MSQRALLPCLCLALISALLVLFTGGATYAEGTHTPFLLPDSPRGFVELSAFRLEASLVCAEICTLEVTHTYAIKNRDRIKQAEIALKVEGHGASVTFEPARGVTPKETDAWVLRLDREETITARLQYTEPLEGHHFLHWAWDSAPLQKWGSITSARIEWRFPVDVPQRIILTQTPSAHGFDGRRLYWEYENPSSIPMFDMWLIAPATWSQLEQSDSGLAYAQFLQELRQEALARQAPYPDPYPRIIAELTRAAESDITAYRALAQIYLQRAEELPQLAPNYRLLAAQALEKAVDALPQETALTKQLGEIYYALAQDARQNGALAEALQYLEQARAYQDQDAAVFEEMTLAWATDMAAKGQTTWALVRSMEVLSPRMRDALFHYAPPIVAARTEITLTPSSRTALYHLYLYPPLAKETTAQLQNMVDALNAFEPSCAQLQTGGTETAPRAEITLTFHYTHLSELQRVSHFFGQTEPNLLGAYLAMPWEALPEKMEEVQTPWFTHYLYREIPQMATLLNLQNEQAQYTTWRLIEVASEHPQEERARLEQQLIALALRDQRDIWENLASSSSWTYHVDFDTLSFVPAWLIGWGHERALVFNYRIYHWKEIATHTGIGVGSLLLVSLLVVRGRKRRSPTP